MTNSTLEELDPKLRKLVDDHVNINNNTNINNSYPFVTLTYAQSLDSKIAAAPGERTVISGKMTKSMTHYIRYKHDAILVGINTVIVDNPNLNCKHIDNNNNTNKIHFLTPIILDPNFKFENQIKNIDNKLISNYKSKINSKPIFIVDKNKSIKSDILNNENIDLIFLDTITDKFGNKRFDWNLLLKTLKLKLKIKSLMIEGGANIINDLLITKNNLTNLSIINSLIITIGPVFLGENGVSVHPNNPLIVSNTTVWTDNSDIVLFSHFNS